MNFRDYPTQIGEGRARKADLWTPREALIAMLRKIDKGKVAPDSLAIVYRFKDELDEHVTTQMMTAGTLVDKQLMVGMLHYAMHLIEVEDG